MEFVTLNNGIKMPILGYGVYQVDRQNVSAAYWMRLRQVTAPLTRHKLITTKMVLVMP